MRRWFSLHRHARLGWAATAFLASASAPIVAQDVDFVVVMKGQEYSQTRADYVSLGEFWSQYGSEPVLIFESYAVGHTMESLVEASITIPGGAVVPLLRDPGEDEDPRELITDTGATSMLSLDYQRPDGAYTVQLQTQNQGTLQIPLSLTGSAYPPVPQVINYDALQSVDAGADMTVQWSPMNGDNFDYIVLRVYEEDDQFPAFHSGAPGEPGALDGTATQVVIPAGSLSPGVRYKTELLFVNTVDINTSVVPLAVAGYYKMVCLWLQTAPEPNVATGASFIEAIPADWAMDVPRDSAVSFRFSRPMSTSDISVGWSSNGGSLSTGSIIYEWTQGNTVLLCKFGQDLPPDSDIGWSLDLTGFKDAAGFALSGAREGSFHTSVDDPAVMPDVSFLSVVKQQHYRQVAPAPVVEGPMGVNATIGPVATGMWECNVEMEMSAYNLVRSATVTTPENGSSANLDFSDWDPYIYLDGEFASQQDLNRFHANGTYHFAVDTLNDGLMNLSVSLGETDDYPEAPVLNNLAELQAVDPDAPMVITWNAPTGGSSEPGVGVVWVSLIIDDANGNEVLWAEGGELDSISQFTIPAGSLRPGRNYEISVRFVKITDWDDSSFPDTILAAGFESITAAAMRTTGTPAMPSVVIQRNGAGMEIVGSGGENDMGYILEASSDMRQWQQLSQFWVGPGGYSHYDDDAQYLKSRFYRVRQNPGNEQIAPYVSIQGTVRRNGVPVAGAVVGTSLDGRTAVSDSLGRFFLITETAALMSSTPYTIHVTYGGNTLSFGPGVWGDQPRDQVFTLP